jgi:hypothetical protein
MQDVKVSNPTADNNAKSAPSVPMALPKSGAKQSVKTTRDNPGAVTYTRAVPDNLRANVPQDMRALPIWMLWKQGPPKANGEKRLKIPFYANGTTRGTIDGSKEERCQADTPEDRSQLVTFEVAMAVYERNANMYMGPAIALGRVPGTPLIVSGIDPDNSVSNGVIAPSAHGLVTTADSYSEFSPSRTGLKIFGTGDIGKETTAGYEMYADKRFFCVTGERVAGDHLADLKAAAALNRELLHQNGVPQKKKAKNKADSTITKKPVDIISSKSNGNGAGQVVDGERHNALISFLGTLRARGLNDEEISREARVFNDTRCSPPLAQPELYSIVKSAFGWRKEYARNDTGNAHRMLDYHGTDVHWVLGTPFIVWTAEGWDPEDKKTCA